MINRDCLEPRACSSSTKCPARVYDQAGLGRTIKMMHIAYTHAPVEDGQEPIGRVDEEQGVNCGEVFAWAVVAVDLELNHFV